MDLRPCRLRQPQAVGIVGEAERSMIVGGAVGPRPCQIAVLPRQEAAVIHAQFSGGSGTEDSPPLPLLFKSKGQFLTPYLLPAFRKRDIRHRIKVSH